MIQRRKTGIFVVIASVCVLWEGLFRLGLINPIRFSHPLGVLQTLADPSFLTGFFRAMLLQMAFISLSGGSIGMILGGLVSVSNWLALSVLRILRIGLWFPLLIFWAFPTWPPREGFWHEAFLWVLIVGLTSVTLSAAYQYISFRLHLRLNWRAAMLQAARPIFLQAFFISLISQIWISPHGWNWFDLGGTNGVAVGYTALILLIIVLFSINFIFHYNFEEAARLRGTFVVMEVTYQRWSSFFGAAFLVAVCTGLWQIYGNKLNRYSLVGSPVEILQAGYRLIISGTGKEDLYGLVWIDTGVSLLEILFGLMVGAFTAGFVYYGLYRNARFRASTLPLIPLTYVVPLVGSVFWLAWVGAFGGPLRTTIGIALITFFPLLQTLVGLKNQDPLCRIFMAVDEALPFAFVAMIFGEAVNTTVGLGFFILSARSDSLISEATAAALMAFGLLVLFSSTIRLIVKRFYFNPKKLTMESPPGLITSTNRATS